MFAVNSPDRAQSTEGRGPSLAPGAPLAVQTTERPAEVRPPAWPWKEIGVREPPTGYLSYYIADDLSSLPVRAVTLPGNNKADPNLETATYGLFSTCERLMRAGIVARGTEYLFFLTNQRSAGRRLTGYYRLKWCYQHARGDFALAATDQYFVSPALAPTDLAPALRALVFSRFRGYKILDADATAGLLALIRARPDTTGAYLAEIDRLERFNAYHTGHRHWGSREPFTWEAAQGYIRSDTVTAAKSNVSPTNEWKCSSCSAQIFNRALLRSCPNCQGLGTLQPVNREAIA